MPTPEETARECVEPVVNILYVHGFHTKKVEERIIAALRDAERRGRIAELKYLLSVPSVGGGEWELLARCNLEVRIAELERET